MMVVCTANPMLFTYFFFFFPDTSTTEIYTLSLHDALPLTTLIQRSGVRPSFDFLHTLIAKIRSNRASCVTSLSRKAFHRAIIAAIQDKGEGVIDLKVEDTKDAIARYICVSKCKRTEHIS